MCPLRINWGLDSKEPISPALEDKICYTATSTLSYVKASGICKKWGSEIDDSLIHRIVDKKGTQCQDINKKRVDRALNPSTRQEFLSEVKAKIPNKPFSLVIMMDGWMSRDRGAEWGMKPSDKSGSRVEWREIKTGIVFRLDHRHETKSGRRVITEKYYEAYQGSPHEFGRRMFAQALRRGLYQAQTVYVVADGGIWIWNIVNERFPESVRVLDFYHVTQHLYAVAHEVYENEEEGKQWVSKLTHQLNHGGEDYVVKTIENLENKIKELSECSRKIVEREIKYFQNHRNDMHYKKVESAGCPKGSGAVESTCSQFQDRFKRTGQFWTERGKMNLMSLDMAERNGDWDEIWGIAV